MIKTAGLTPFERSIVLEKATEKAFTGEYSEHFIYGTYLCRNCGISLFKSDNKFDSSCGWPSFDREISNRIEQLTDADGIRVEILCKRCSAHLGHIFHGEKYTTLNTRHCVNSASLDFVPFANIDDTEEVILAAGCFWGVEYYLDKLEGILLTEVGYCGGTTNYPSYKEVCKHNTGHLEAVRVIFDPTKITLSGVLKYFFEIHDPSQTDGQGQDIGPQYLSAIFCYNEEQKGTAKQLINLLTEKGYNIATTIRDASPFWLAETYHHDYYANNGQMPYCHKYTKRF